jgi:hypothetical protein
LEDPQDDTARVPNEPERTTDNAESITRGPS